MDLFSGLGGFALGLERTGGFRTVAFCEIDIFCRYVLLKHWPGVPLYSDVRELTGAQLIIDGVCDVAGKLKKLTLAQVDVAVDLYQSDWSLADVADLFSVSRQAMHDLLKRRIGLRPQLRYAVENHFYRGGPMSDDRAHNIVENAIKRGVLVPQPCEICGANGTFAEGRREVHAHHDDYAKPLAVRWLCQKHHHEWHTLDFSRKEAREPTRTIDLICGGFP